MAASSAKCLGAPAAQQRVLVVNPDSVVPCVSWYRKESNLSSFDNKLLFAWKDAVSNGYFRYKVNIQGSKTIAGKWNFYTELNPERGEKRRKPQEFHSLNEPFNPMLFNFTNIKDKEILFKLRIEDGTQRPESDDFLAINVSPISEGHSLILPCVNKRYPQVLTQYSIELSLHLLLISSTPSFRVAFNSLCAFASVNHLHLHCLYIDQPMSLESADLQPLEGPCFQISNYPAKGVVFQCEAKQKDDIETLAKNVFKLTSFLVSKNEAHNIMMTRSKLRESEKVLSYIRVYVWIRTSNVGAKQTTGFNPAALEFFGYFISNNLDGYNNIDEESTCKVLEDLTSEPFKRNCEGIRKLFRE